MGRAPQAAINAHMHSATAQTTLGARRSAMSAFSRQKL
jgi:hypothetical protein